MKRYRVLCIAGILALSISPCSFAQGEITKKEANEIARRADRNWESETYYGETDLLILNTVLNVTCVTPENEKQTASVPVILAAEGDFIRDEITGWSKKHFVLTASTGSGDEEEDDVLSFERTVYVFLDPDSKQTRFYLRDLTDPDGEGEWCYYEVPSTIKTSPLYFSMNRILESWSKYQELMQFDVSVDDSKICLSSDLSMLDMKQFIDRYEEIETGLDDEQMKQLEEWMDSVKVSYKYYIDAATETSLSIEETFDMTDVDVLNDFLVTMQSMYYQSNLPEISSNFWFSTIEEGDAFVSLARFEPEGDYLELPEGIETAEKIENLQEYAARCIVGIEGADYDENVLLEILGMLGN